METVALGVLGEKLLAEARSASSGRHGVTIHGGHVNSLRQTLIGIASGHVLDEHENTREVTLHLIRGRARVVAGLRNCRAVSERLRRDPARVGLLRGARGHRGPAHGGRPRHTGLTSARRQRRFPRSGPSAGRSHSCGANSRPKPTESSSILHDLCLLERRILERQVAAAAKRLFIRRAARIEPPAPWRTSWRPRWRPWPLGFRSSSTAGRLRFRRPPGLASFRRPRAGCVGVRCRVSAIVSARPRRLAQRLPR